MKSFLPEKGKRKATAYLCIYFRKEGIPQIFLETQLFAKASLSIGPISCPRA